MNLPNKLTVLRIILVPFFVAALLIPGVPHHFLIAGLLFGIASYTDHLDGKIARRDNLITTFGKFLDPLADKVLVVSALVCFVELKLAPAWMVLLIIAREFLVTSLRLVAVDAGVVIAANSWGKAKTASQMTAISIIFVLQYIQELSMNGILGPVSFGSMQSDFVFYWIGFALLFVSTILTVISGTVYVSQNRAVINASK